jgi:O-antigen ligase
MNGLVWFVVAPGERRFIFYGIYILIALTGTILAIASRLLRPTVGWIFVGVLCLGLMLANTRSLFVSSAIVLFVGLLGGKLVHGKTRPTNLQSIIATAIILISLGTFLFLRTKTGRDFAERSAEELASGVLNSGEDPDWQFRLFAWREAWRRFAEYPLAGEGFGMPFTFERLLLENDPRPHNTFLTVLYKMGLAGFLSFVALLIYFPWKGLQWLRRHDESVRVTFLRIVLLAQIAFCVYGMANLLLESPFLASLFWTSMGLGLRIIRMLYLDRSLPPLLGRVT